MGEWERTVRSRKADEQDGENAVAGIPFLRALISGLGRLAKICRIRNSGISYRTLGAGGDKRCWLANLCYYSQSSHNTRKVMAGGVPGQENRSGAGSLGCWIIK